VTPPNDRRVRRTLGALQGALLALMAERDYDSIGVSDIIERADVGRSTFYNHYTDKADLLQDCLAGLQEVARVPPSTGGGHFAFSLPLLTHANEQRQLAQALNNRFAAGPPLADITAILDAALRAELASTGESGASRDAHASFLAGGFLFLLSWWLRQDEPGTPDDIDRLFREFAGGGA